MNFDAYIEECEKRFVPILKKNFKARIDKARNKEKALQDFVKLQLTSYYLCFKQTEYRRYLIDGLFPDYELGYDLEYKIKDILEFGRFLQSIEDRMDENDVRLNRSEKTIARFFAKYTSFQMFVQYLQKEYPEIYEAFKEEEEENLKREADRISHLPFERELPVKAGESAATSPLYFTTGIRWQKNNETEFVQMVYCLFHAGVLDNQGKGVTKLVEEMAALFHYTLSPHWQSNLSNSIGRAKMDYQPAIIKTIQKGFEKLIEERNRK